MSDKYKQTLTPYVYDAIVKSPLPTSPSSELEDGMKAVEIREFIGSDGSVLKGDVVDVVGEGSTVASSSGVDGKMDEMLKRAVSR